MSNVARIVKLPAEDHTEAMRMIHEHLAEMKDWSAKEMKMKKEIKDTETIIMGLQKNREGTPEKTPEGWVRLGKGTMLAKGDQVFNFQKKEFWDVEKYSHLRPNDSMVDNIYAIRKLTEEKKPEKPKQKELTSGEFLDKMNSMV